ncbi:MAG: Fic family protein [Chitinophagaceae bacterium]|nr:MAG: Fic family protein [Chitinophagaceae bacterium]
MHLLPTTLLPTYRAAFPAGAQQAFERLVDAELSTAHFSFYTSVASVFSSKIEGERIELDSYVKHKRDGVPFQADYTKKTDDLYSAYLFAQGARLTKGNVKKAHELLSRHLVAASGQGQYRRQNMYVMTDDGRIEYVAAPPAIVEMEMQRFFSDVALLLGEQLTIAETFYFASMIHLLFVKIHPWSDGNGRSARLLEKWFLSEKLGPKAWYLQSEKHYYQNHASYYHNLRALGLEYETLDYAKALPFALMLPNAL